MDRNEAFRKRLDIKLNKGKSVGKSSFDPTPYVDILMEKTYYEEVEDLQEFIDDVMSDPDFDYIFGKSSLLNTEQKSNTAAMLLQRVDAYLDFNPNKHAQYLIDIYGTPAFDKYIETDEDDGEEYYDFSAYYADYDFTKEQKNLISETFIELQEGESPEYDTLDGQLNKRRRRSSFFIASIIFIPPLFIPNLLQYFGVLPPDAGWLLKIGVGAISLIVIFIFVSKILQILTNYAIKKMRKR